MGFVLARMGLFLRQFAPETAPGGHPHGHPGHEFMISGVIFLAIGTALAGISAWLHDRNRRAIDAGDYQPSRFAVFGLAAVVVAGGLVIVALVIFRTSLGPD